MIAQGFPTFVVSSLYQKDKPKLTENEFEQWLTGFIDAEGNFQVVLDRGYVRTIFRINLHIDDCEVLEKIQQHLQVGNVSKSKRSATFTIYSISDITNQLFPLLEKNPLKTTKYLDYIDFRTIVQKLNKSETSLFTGDDLLWVTNCMKNMNLGRMNADISMIPSEPINKFWLLGFIEGEGTFGYKNLVPYFQIAQHSRNVHVLVNVASFINKLQSQFTFSHQCPPLKTTHTVNKNTQVISIIYTDIDSLHDILAFNMLDLEFQTRKKVDFIYWCLMLYIHKFGYFYLAQGRQMAMQIAASSNAHRYSTSGENVHVPDLNAIIEFINMQLPVKLQPNQNHTQFARHFVKHMGPQDIWVYDFGTLVPGSPFQTKASAGRSVGANQITVKRFLDTNKLYLDRYSFTTINK